MPNRTVTGANTVLDHWRALTAPHTAATFAPDPHQWEFIRQRLKTQDGRSVDFSLLQNKYFTLKEGLIKDRKMFIKACILYWIYLYFLVTDFPNQIA